MPYTEYDYMIDKIDEALMELNVSITARKKILAIIADEQHNAEYVIDDKSLRKAAYRAAAKREE